MVWHDILRAAAGLSILHPQQRLLETCTAVRARLCPWLYSRVQFLHMVCSPSGVFRSLLKLAAGRVWQHCRHCVCSGAWVSLRPRPRFIAAQHAMQLPARPLELLGCR